jgi:hypothetical protein
MGAGPCGPAELARAFVFNSLDGVVEDKRTTRADPDGGATARLGLRVGYVPYVATHLVKKRLVVVVCVDHHRGKHRKALARFTHVTAVLGTESKLLDF